MCESTPTTFTHRSFSSLFVSFFLSIPTVYILLLGEGEGEWWKSGNPLLHKGSSAFEAHFKSSIFSVFLFVIWLVFYWVFDPVFSPILASF